VDSGKRMSKAGDLIVTAQQSRSQTQNLAHALAKIAQLCAEAAEVPKATSEEKLARIEALGKLATKKRRREKDALSRGKATRRVGKFD
jgi:protein subunit release factor B